MSYYFLQDVERNTEPQHKRPDLIPDLTSESEMELEQVSHQLRLFKFIYFVLLHLTFYSLEIINVGFLLKINYRQKLTARFSRRPHSVVFWPKVACFRRCDILETE